MWSWHLFLGLHFGVEFYTNSVKEKMYDFFIIDIGFIRIQKTMEINLDFIPEDWDKNTNVVDSGKVDFKIKVK